MHRVWSKPFNYTIFICCIIRGNITHTCNGKKLLSHRKSKYRPVLRGSRVNDTSQKAAEWPVRRQELPVDKRSDGNGASENGNEYCKLCSGFYYDRSHKYFSDDWFKCRVRLGITSPAVKERGRKDLFVNLVFKLMESPHAKLQSSIT